MGSSIETYLATFRISGNIATSAGATFPLDWLHPSCLSHFHVNCVNFGYIYFL